MMTEYSYFIVGLFISDMEDIFREYENDDPEEVCIGWYDGAYSLNYIYNKLIKNKKEFEDKFKTKKIIGYKRPYYDREARNYNIQAFVEDCKSRFPNAEDVFTVGITLPENEITIEHLRELRHTLRKEWEKLAIENRRKNGN